MTSRTSPSSTMSRERERMSGGDLRVIRTARTEQSINEAARDGYRPLIKRVAPDPSIHSKFAVYQHRTTGEIQVTGDFRGLPSADEYDEVIGWTDYYPYAFPGPFAAYLIPADIEVGERVFVEDVIEDLVGATWNQGDVYRLESSEAVWDGSDLIIEPGPDGELQIVG